MMKHGYGYYEHGETLFAIKEAYRTIRTNLLFSIVKDGCKTIAFTSSVQAEGKTTTSVNVALSLSQNEKKVLLIDLDLRKPRVHKLTKIQNVPGVTNYLGGFNKFEEVLHRDVFPGLDVITSGTITPNPSELIASEGMRTLLNKLQAVYDYIIIDTPPVCSVSDALSIIPSVDGVVVVTRYKYTHHGDLKEAIDQINFVGGKITGVIVNGTDNFKRNGKYSRYGKYSKYGGYGKYGYYYSSDPNEDDQNEDQKEEKK